jgi:hypothetical protein
LHEESDEGRVEPNLIMKRFHRIIAALVLMAYAITGTSLVTAVAVVLAELDGSHDVMISESAQVMQLVLHHRHGEYTPQTKDHSKCMARVLVSFCRQDQEGDHCLSPAHVSSTAITERFNAAKSGSLPLTLNLNATLALILSLELPVCDMIRMPMAMMASRIPSQPASFPGLPLLI